MFPYVHFVKTFVKVYLKSYISTVDANRCLSKWLSLTGVRTQVDFCAWCLYIKKKFSYVLAVAVSPAV